MFIFFGLILLVIGGIRIETSFLSSLVLIVLGLIFILPGRAKVKTKITQEPWSVPLDKEGEPLWKTPSKPTPRGVKKDVGHEQ